MSHSGYRPKKAESLSASRNTELSGLHSLGQAHTISELLAMSANNQGHHQVNAAYDCALADLLGQSIPMRIKNIVFQLVICNKIHGYALNSDTLFLREYFCLAGTQVAAFPLEYAISLSANGK